MVDGSVGPTTVFTGRASLLNGRSGSGAWVIGGGEYVGIIPTPPAYQSVH